MKRLIDITNQDIDNGLSISFNWEESNDVDNDLLEYNFKFYNGTTVTKFLEKFGNFNSW